jgi:hypothetical protein
MFAIRRKGQGVLSSFQSLLIRDVCNIEEGCTWACLIGGLLCRYESVGGHNF